MIRLFSFSTPDHEQGIGVDTDEGVIDVSRALTIYQKAKGVRSPIPVTFLQILVEMGYCSQTMMADVLQESWVKSKLKELRLASGFRWELPIARPSKIICLGRNYRAHARELDHDIPQEPIIFCKAPSSLIPHEAEIRIPAWMDERVDYEAELALVIGRSAKNTPREHALDHISGYTILNDVTARSIQKADMERKQPWFRSKSLDTFCPMGPYLTPQDSGINPNDLEITLTQNGEPRQKANTSSMIFPIPDILSFVSRFMTLHPGDVIATGTPEGIGPIQDGDELEITISGLGTLKNRVVRETV